jgi:hypothetical protein
MNDRNSFLRRLQLSLHIAWDNLNWKEELLDAAQLISVLGLLSGVAVEPFLRWVGHPLKDRQPVWVTVLCGTVLILLPILRRAYRVWWLSRELDEVDPTWREKLDAKSK